MRWLALLALGIVACMADDEMPCTIHHKGRYYDLNPLKSTQDYEFRTPDNNLFVINVCRRPVKESFGLRDVDDAKIAGFVRRGHGDFSIGEVNPTLSMYDDNPRMTLSGGSYCKLKSGDTELRGSTIVDFVCDTSVFGTGEPRLVAQFPPGKDDDACGYFLQWRTHIACPTNEPGGAWGFFSVIVFILISLALLYLVAGTLYNRFVLRLRGMDQFPRFSIESMRYHASEAIDWFKDLTGMGSNQYNYRMPEDGLPSTGGLGSGAFPRSAPSTGGINPVSHHTQVSSPPPATAESLGGGGGGGGGFVRPYHSRTISASKKADINPVSHQAQASAPVAASPPSHSQLQAHDKTPSPAPAPSSTSPAPATGVKKEKPRPQPFDLGDDEDDVALNSAASTGGPLQSQPQTSVAAQERGRDLGDGEGVVRL